MNYENLPEFMGPQTPSKELLLTYDANKDGRWTLEEMQKAFGFPAPTTPCEYTKKAVDLTLMLLVANSVDRK